MKLLLISAHLQQSSFTKIAAYLGFDYSKTNYKYDNFLPLLGLGVGVSINLAASIGKGYYGYKAAKEQIRREISDGIWQLNQEEIQAVNNIQKRLLTSTWELLRKYNIPNEYRLTQENIKEYLNILDETEPSKRLARLKFIERKFQVYPALLVFPS